MTWNTYKLDETAQDLVLTALERSAESLNQSYKMRTNVSFGLERFWGEHIRLLAKNRSSDDYQKGLYWHDTWKAFRETMKEAYVFLPEPLMNVNDTEVIKTATKQFWGEAAIKVDSADVYLTLEDRRIAQAVLTQLCDCLVWWTQRYKDLGEKRRQPMAKGASSSPPVKKI
ncbi:MAG: hypothetical protein VKL39_11865 [Leptolyngbyaceae bacterium]|nr:hypothetical protein [Leptolyngbyaceae bacterium]